MTSVGGTPAGGRDSFGIANWPAPARLTVGIISAGKVGVAVGEALEKAGHVVTAIRAQSASSVRRTTTRLPETRILPADAVAAESELLVLAVPDTQLAAVVARLEPVVNPSAIVLHTSGAFGAQVLAPLAEKGCTPIAFHPAMTFIDTIEDTIRLRTACIGITAVDEIGYAVGQALALEIGGEPVRVREEARPLYHAALAHGANHLVALVVDAVALLRIALAHNEFDGGVPITEFPDGLPERILEPLLSAALDNALRRGIGGLTGPAARDDVAGVRTHLAAVAEADPDIASAYRALSLRAATLSGASAPLINLLKGSAR